MNLAHSCLLQRNHLPSGLPDTESVVLSQLDLDGRMSVKDFLALRLPCEAPSTHVQQLQDWFSLEDPNFAPTEVADLLLPPRGRWRVTGMDIEQAVSRGCRSLRHPTSTEILLPIWVARVYSLALRITDARQRWNRAAEWITRRASAENWAEAFVAAVRAALNDAPWGEVKLIEFASNRLDIYAPTLAETLLSEALVGDAVLKSIQIVLEADMRTTSALLADPVISQNFSSRSANFVALRVAEREHKVVLLPYNIGNKHWILLIVHPQSASNVIAVSDSSPGFTRQFQNEIRDRVARWLTNDVDRSWTVDFDLVDAPRQRDSHMCGIAIANEMHRCVLPTTCSWSPERSSAARAYYFYRCICFGLQVASIVSDIPISR